MTALLSATRLLTSFGVLLGAYWVYALIVVPIIEPDANIRSSAHHDGGSNGPPSRERYHDLLVGLFPEDAWERSSPKILETEQGLLLFRDHKTLPGGEMEVFPFTVVLRAADDEQQRKSATQKRKRPLVLRAPEGATLAFDKKLDLTRGDIGKLERARLRGKITIFGPESRPGANDELNIVTHNVHIDQQRIVTRHDVSFRMGPHYGSGRNLTIDLLPKKSSGNEEVKQQFGNIKLLELVHVEKINLQLKGGGLLGESQPKKASTADKPPTPVEITCRGPFQFDFVKSVASFEDHVNVVSLHPEGAADQLNCQLLEVHVNPESEPSKTTKDVTSTDEVDDDANDEEKGSGLDVRRLVAVGHPVNMRVPSRNAEAIGERLVYDFPERRITLTAPDKVSLKHGSDHVEARSIDYTIAENNRIGTLVAIGPGWILHKGEEKKPGFTARWNRLLDMQPRDGRHVVSILGEAQVGFEGMGQIHGDEIFMWLREVPKVSVVNDHQNPARERGMSDDEFADSSPERRVGVENVPANTAQKEPTRKQRTEVLPDKLLARGNVTIESPQLSARTKKLEAWFEHVSPTEAISQRGGGQSGDSNRLALGSNPLIKRPGQKAADEKGEPLKKQQKFDLTGDLIRAKLLQVGRNTEISGIDVAGNVTLVEIDGFELGEQPMRIRGNVLQLIPNKDKLARVSVVGEPARVAARGLVMQSGRVDLDQATNMMWIDQPGEMTLPAQRQKSPRKLPDALPAAVQRKLRDSHITWKGRMHFDGRTFHVEKDVVFRGEQLLESGEVINLNGRSQSLDIALMQPISFTETPKDRNKKTEIRQLALDGGVYLENHGRDERGRPASVDRLATNNLVIDYFTGEIRADGRGWMKTVRRGDDKLTKRVGRMGAPKPKPEKANESLVYVHVTFDDGISGDVLRREVNFNNNVEAIYGPVLSWDDELDPTRRGGLGEEGVSLTCDKLTIAEMGPKIDGRRALELQATGNTHIEGDSFEASADKVSFAEAKKVIVLEGNNRDHAELWHQHRIGAQRDHAAARKIRYWQDENRVEVEDARFLDLSRGGVGFGQN